MVIKIVYNNESAVVYDNVNSVIQEGGYIKIYRRCKVIADLNLEEIKNIIITNL